MERMEQGECPVCGHRPQVGDDSHASDDRLAEFQGACRAELEKINALARDLNQSLSVMLSEDRSFALQQEQLRAALDTANVAIQGLLQRKIRDADSDLSLLLSQQARLSEAAFMANDVLDLQTRFSSVQGALSVKVDRPKLAKKVEAAGAAEFCTFVEATLVAWKFPVSGNVSWSEDHFDLVIGGENRGSMGKGFRAVTHSAFTVALMRYCRAKGLPHPGFVILDTPLNPYRGADRSATDGINMEVQEAFYADLAADKSGDQVIVFENTEPPKSVRDALKYTHFSGNTERPPAGLFPRFLR